MNKFFVIVVGIFAMLAALCVQAQDLQNEDRCGALPAFSADINTALPNQTIASGAASVRIASFRIWSSKTEAKDMSSVTLQTNIPSDLSVQNLTVKINGVTQNFVVSVLQDGLLYTFTTPESQIRIPTCEFVTVDVFTDLLSSTSVGTYQMVNLVQAIANGVVSNTSQILTHRSTGTAVTSTDPVFGQSFNVVSAASANLMSLFSNLFGTPGEEVRLGSWIVRANNAEDLRMDLTVLRFHVTSKTQCPGVNWVRVVAQSGAGTFAGTGGVPVQNEGSYTTAVLFQNAGAIIPKNTQAVITAYGTIRDDCRISTIITEVRQATDIRLFGWSSDQLIIPTGTFPLVGGSVTVQ